MHVRNQRKRIKEENQGRKNKGDNGRACPKSREKDNGHPCPEIRQKQKISESKK